MTLDSFNAVKISFRRWTCLSFAECKGDGERLKKDSVRGYLLKNEARSLRKKWKKFTMLFLHFPVSTRRGLFEKW